MKMGWRSVIVLAISGIWLACGQPPDEGEPVLGQASFQITATCPESMVDQNGLIALVDYVEGTATYINPNTVPREVPFVAKLSLPIDCEITGGGPEQRQMTPVALPMGTGVLIRASFIGHWGTSGGSGFTPVTCLAGTYPVAEVAQLCDITHAEENGCSLLVTFDPPACARL